MASQKLTDLTAASSTGSGDLYLITQGSESKQLDFDVLVGAVGSSPLASSPVENEYADITALLADQSNQTDTYFQYVTDASADPEITSGDAYYEKLTASTSSLSDYRLLSDTETEVIRDSNSYRVFKIKAIQDDSTPITSVSGGKISFEYNTGSGLVTAVVFNKIYTDALLNFYQTDVNLKFYNRSTKEYQKAAISSSDWSTVGTHYYKALLGGTITASDLSVNDKIENFIDLGGGIGGITRIEETQSSTIKADKIYTRHGTNKFTQSGNRSVTLDNTDAKITAFTSEQFTTDGNKILFDILPFSYDLNSASGVTVGGDGKSLEFATADNIYRVLYEWLGVASGWHITVKDYILSTGEIVYNSSLLYLSTPEERTVITDTSSIDISCIAENASSIEFFYKNTSDVWVSIGAATNTSGDIWDKDTWLPSATATEIKATATYPDASTQDVINSLFSVGILDTFTDTNGVNITAHTPDESLGGGWIVNSGDWEIQSNELTITTADTNTHSIVHDLGMADCVMKFQISAAATSLSNHQAYLRYIDSSNNLRINFQNDGYIKLGRFVGGTYTQISNINMGSVYGKEIEIRITNDTFNLVVDKYGTPSYYTEQAIPYHTSATKFGFGRPGADDDYHYNQIEIQPVTLPEINTDVSYTSTKNGSLILTKNSYPTYDSNGISSPCFYKVGSTNYMIHSAKDGTSSWSGLMYATAPDSDPHNWTRVTGLVLTSGTEEIADCTAYWNGTTLYVLYSSYDDGKIYYATGTDVTSLTEQGELLDLTGQGLYARHPDIQFFNNTFYLYVDVRRDHPSGEYGDIWVGSGAAITSLSDFREVLSTPAFEFDLEDVGAPSVRFNDVSGYYEMIYSGYEGGGIPYNHQTGLAICKQPDGKFVRVDSDPLIVAGVGSYDEIISTPCWYLDLEVVYYTCKDNSGEGNDGFAYTTLS